MLHPVPYVYAGAPEHQFELTYWLHKWPVLDRHGAVLSATDIKSWHSQDGGGGGGGGDGDGNGGEGGGNGESDGGSGGEALQTAA